jgi:hypothetical protein
MEFEDYEEKNLSSSKQEARLVTLDHFVPIYFLSLVYISCMHSLVI